MGKKKAGRKYTLWEEKERKKIERKEDEKRKNDRKWLKTKKRRNSICQERGGVTRNQLNLQ